MTTEQTEVISSGSVPANVFLLATIADLGRELEDVSDAADFHAAGHARMMARASQYQADLDAERARAEAIVRQLGMTLAELDDARKQLEAASAQRRDLERRVTDAERDRDDAVRRADETTRRVRQVAVERDHARKERDRARQELEVLRNDPVRATAALVIGRWLAVMATVA